MATVKFIFNSQMNNIALKEVILGLAMSPEFSYSTVGAITV